MHFALAVKLQLAGLLVMLINERRVLFGEFGESGGEAAPEADKVPGKSGEIDDLKRQLDEMKRKVDRLTDKGSGGH